VKVLGSSGNAHCTWFFDIGNATMRLICVISALICGLVHLVSMPVLAQDERVYQSARALTGREVRLAFFARANTKDCKALALPDIQVVTPPKNGALTIRNVPITTNQYQGCPDLKLRAVALFYRSNAGYLGQDSVAFIVTFENGQSQAHSFAITVAKDGEPTNAPAPSKGI
jgi:hypothetical protein